MPIVMSNIKFLPNNFNTQRHDIPHLQKKGKCSEMPGNCGACSHMLAVMLALLGCLIVGDMLQLEVFDEHVS